MNSIYNDILSAKKQQKKLLAILLDPEKIQIEKLNDLAIKINQSIATHIFVGGSTVQENATDILVRKLKTITKLPIILFPGDFTQISNNADALLFLSLTSGRNPEYLIEQQVKAAPILKKSNLEIISTSYILIDGGNTTTVQKVSQTIPIQQTKIDLIINTAMAGEMLGHKLLYLEAGSGALNPINPRIIESLYKNISIPIIVGGGIRDYQTIENAYNAGATLVVIGTAFENDSNFFQKLTN